MMKVDKIGKKEKQTYIESLIIFILFLLTLTSLVLSGIGFVMPKTVSMDVYGPMLTNILLTFMIAELVIVILLLNRIYQK
jgi:hypothetical protein